MNKSKAEQLRDGLSLSMDEKIAADSLLIFFMDLGSQASKELLRQMLSMNDGVADMKAGELAALIDTALIHASAHVKHNLKDEPDDVILLTLGAMGTVSGSKIMEDPSGDFPEYLRRVCEWIWNGMEE
ncbi:MAG: hypothetical protein LUE87_05760 [Lachnospiraceae bacterium]|nr:hypothetical protein [Lachnospiraceae bacterium]